MQARDFLLWLCRELGICVNLAKSSLTPSQTIDYLGMRLQTCPLRVFPTPKRVLKLSSLVHDFLSCPLQQITMWRQLLGVMSSMSPLVPGSRLRMRSLQLRLNVGARFLVDSEVVSWDDSCLLSHGRSSTRPASTRPVSVHRRLGYRLGRFAQG